MTTAPRKRIRIKTRATTPEALVLGLRGVVELRGFFVRGAPSLPVGAPVALELQLADGARALEGEGVVERHVLEGPRAGMALALAWHAESHALLERLLASTVEARPAEPPMPARPVEPLTSARPEPRGAPAPRTPTTSGVSASGVAGARALPPLPTRLASATGRRHTGDLSSRPSTGDLALTPPTPTGDVARRTTPPIRASVTPAPSSLPAPATEPGASPPSVPPDAVGGGEAARPSDAAPPSALPSIPVSWPAEAVTPAVVHPWEAPPRASDAPFVVSSSPASPPAVSSAAIAVSGSPPLPIEAPVLLEPEPVFAAREPALPEPVLPQPASGARADVPRSGPHGDPSELMPFALAPDPTFASDPRIALTDPRDPGAADPLEALSIVDPVWSDLPEAAPAPAAADLPPPRREDVRALAWSAGVVLDVQAVPSPEVPNTPPFGSRAPSAPPAAAPAFVDAQAFVGAQAFVDAQAFVGASSAPPGPPGASSAPPGPPGASSAPPGPPGASSAPPGPPGASSAPPGPSVPRVSVDLERWVEPDAPKKGGVIGWLKRAFSSE